ncbi:LysR family transcriptional regulator [Variovorax sp. Sphag1AA]|uniref:LysR family transcriptional regulator n=1 Tax=Variovorax sp. Sphag1AA TaxID=2587027 RepID=UPI0021A27022|nr:LysR family transcriptional regulator [Variovorax sp. Sphag1AA]
MRHLRYFVAVAESGGVHAASQRLHVAQPAVSRQIRALEEEIGAPLFERLPRGLTLTPIGEVFLGEVHRTLAALSHATKTARDMAQGSTGKLSIGMVEAVSWSGFVPAIISAFREAAPHVVVELRPGPTAAQLKALDADEIDAAFLYVFDAVPTTLRAIPLETHDIVLAAPRDWTLPEEGQPVRACALNGRPFVSFPRHVQPLFHDRLVAACSGAGLTLDIVQEAVTDTAVLSLVSAGIGAAIINASNLGRPPALVQFRPLADVSVPMPFTFVHRPDKANAALNRFVNVVHAVRDASDAAAVSRHDAISIGKKRPART